jgi:hypothetical protein
MSFNTDEYIDVAARIAMFAAKYPMGTLQGEGYFVRDVEEKIIGYHYTASAYRTPDDPRPGIGTAYEGIPGKTNFTRDSEVMNAETSAWGRAIVACGFNTKKIASADEVRARQDPVGDSTAGSKASQGSPVRQADPTTVEPASPTGTFTPPADVQENLDRKAASSTPPGDNGVPEEVMVTFGKHKGKKLGELVDLDVNYLTWLATKFEPKTADARRVRGAAMTILEYPEPAGAGAGVVADSDIPFAWTWA